MTDQSNKAKGNLLRTILVIIGILVAVALFAFNKNLPFTAVDVLLMKNSTDVASQVTFDSSLESAGFIELINGTKALMVSVKHFITLTITE